MTNLPAHLATGAFGALILSLWAWHMPWLGVALSLPLLACLPFMIARRSRAFVMGGALALPYICYAMIEILVASGAKPPAAIALLAAGAAFIGLLLPATRHLRRFAASDEPR